jgi:hypothetical protein
MLWDTGEAYKLDESTTHGKSAITLRGYSTTFGYYQKIFLHHLEQLILEPELKHMV